MERSKTRLDSSIHLPIHVYLPKASQILLNDDVIVQKQNPVQRWVHLRQVEPQMIQYGQILRVPKLHIGCILCRILKLVLKVKPLQICRFKLSQHRNIRGVQKLIILNRFNFNMRTVIFFHLEHNLHCS
ncbi:hypothetical protein HanPI659440_Chr04g0163481 [Helianthus annuus]|nr:hypothetical protein HanPI659440_Chr04g0163481 [Helianthus annuus]